MAELKSKQEVLQNKHKKKTYKWDDEMFSQPIKCLEERNS